MCGFNSIVVRLKGRDGVLAPVVASGFNSIVVRLKVGIQHHKGECRGEFQFHSGSIKRQRCLHCSFEHHQFQFHSGSIKSASGFSQLPLITEVSIP